LRQLSEESAKRIDREFIVKLVDGILATVNYSLNNYGDPFKREFSNVFPHYNFYKEYRTINIKLPRQMGNSRILCRLYEKLEYDCIVLTNKISSKEQLNRVQGIKNDDIFTNVQHLMGVKSTVILIDNSSFFKNVDIEELYRMGKFEYFIFIG
jgi:hypothetical protein